MKRFPVLDRAIRQELIAARAACGLTQRELSAKLRRRNNYIQNIESGRQSIGAAELHVIARACGATGAELLASAARTAEK
jgi:transcriptional regulator with XRE-family HTH domain